MDTSFRFNKFCQPKERWEHIMNSPVALPVTKPRVAGEYRFLDVYSTRQANHRLASICLANLVSLLAGVYLMVFPMLIVDWQNADTRDMVEANVIHNQKLQPLHYRFWQADVVDEDLTQIYWPNNLFVLVNDAQPTFLRFYVDSRGTYRPYGFFFPPGVGSKRISGSDSVSFCWATAVIVEAESYASDPLSIVTARVIEQTNEPQFPFPQSIREAATNIYDAMPDWDRRRVQNADDTDASTTATATASTESSAGQEWGTLDPTHLNIPASFTHTTPATTTSIRIEDRKAGFHLFDTDIDWENNAATVRRVSAVDIWVGLDEVGAWTIMRVDPVEWGWEWTGPIEEMNSSFDKENIELIVYVRDVNEPQNHSPKYQGLWRYKLSLFFFSFVLAYTIFSGFMYQIMRKNHCENNGLPPPFFMSMRKYRGW